MAKAKYFNLTFGLKVLAEDSNSFNLNEKGFHLITLLRSNVSKLPKKAEIEEIECESVINNIEKLYCEMVRFNSSIENKEERKKALNSIVYLEKCICNSLGLTLREDENGNVYGTETITINQYNFFESCFSIQHASKKVRNTTNNIIDVVSLNTFKKAVLFGLCEACANDGTLYTISGKLGKVIDRIENKKEKSKK